MIDEAAIPKFRRGVKFRRDEVRDAWVLLAPERLFLPDDTGVEVLKLIDGIRPVGGIIDDLATRFNAPRSVIATDVLATFDDLVTRAAVEC